MQNLSLFKFNFNEIDTQSIQRYLSYTYVEYVNYLLDKYGNVKYDYFSNPKCQTKNHKISRIKEGLYCHHIDEDKTILLSTSDIAQHQPFAYQKADRLVYCTIIEHFILHIKIAEERKDKTSFVGIGGATLIAENINALIDSGISFKWQIPTHNLIKQQYSEYIYLLGYFRNLLRTDIMYSQDPLLSDPFLCFDGTVFVRSIYNDIKNVLHWENYKNIIPKHKWCTKKLYEGDFISYGNT